MRVEEDLGGGLYACRREHWPGTIAVPIIPRTAVVPVPSTQLVWFEDGDTQRPYIPALQYRRESEYSEGVEVEPGWPYLLQSPRRNSSSEFANTFGATGWGQLTAASQHARNIIRLDNDKIFATRGTLTTFPNTEYRRFLDTLGRWSRVFNSDPEEVYDPEAGIVDVALERTGDDPSDLRVYVAIWEDGSNYARSQVFRAHLGFSSEAWAASTVPTRSRVVCLNGDLEVLWESQWLSAELIAPGPSLMITDTEVQAITRAKDGIHLFQNLYRWDKFFGGAKETAGTKLEFEDPPHVRFWRTGTSGVYGVDNLGRGWLAADDQKGIEPSDQTKVFSPYAQVDPPFSRTAPPGPCYPAHIATSLVDRYSAPSWQSTATDDVAHVHWQSRLIHFPLFQRFVPGGINTPQLAAFNRTGVRAWLREGWNPAAKTMEFYTPLAATPVGDVVVRTVQVEFDECTWVLSQFDPNWENPDPQDFEAWPPVIPLTEVMGRYVKRKTVFTDIVRVADGMLLRRHENQPAKIRGPIPLPAPGNSYRGPRIGGNNRLHPPHAHIFHPPFAGEYVYIGGQFGSVALWPVGNTEGYIHHNVVWDEIEYDAPMLYDDATCTISPDGLLMIFAPSWQGGSVYYNSIPDREVTLEHAYRSFAQGDNATGYMIPWSGGEDYKRDLSGWIVARHVYTGNEVWRHEIKYHAPPSRATFANIVCTADGRTIIHYRVNNTAFVRTLRTGDGFFLGEIQLSASLQNNPITGTSSPHGLISPEGVTIANSPNVPNNSNGIPWSSASTEQLVAAGDTAMTSDRGFLVCLRFASS